MSQLSWAFGLKRVFAHVMPDPGALTVFPDVKFTSKIGHPSPQHEVQPETWCTLRRIMDNAINGRNFIFFITLKVVALLDDC